MFFFYELSEGDVSSHEFSSENKFHSVQVKTIIIYTYNEYSYLKFVNIHQVKE